MRISFHSSLRAAGPIGLWVPVVLSEGRGRQNDEPSASNSSTTNLKAVDLTLSAEELKALDEV
jgi:hypothetical protein